jgi:PPOX class probable F420-dependent enzyme
VTALGDFAAEKYVLLTTFRKDGRPVATPLWAVPDGAGLAVWTATGSGKVKRIRGAARVTVAACDARGNQRGETVEARATIGAAADTDRVRRLLGRKYGLLGRLTVLGSKLRRGAAGTVAILIGPA